LTVHPENSLYSPDDSANRSPYHGTDRAGTSVTFIDTVSNTTGYSLRVRSQRNRECTNKYACNQDLSFHQVIPLCDLDTTRCPAITAIGRRAFVSKGA
jgi:hypothetical protein